MVTGQKKTVKASFPWKSKCGSNRSTNMSGYSRRSKSNHYTGEEKGRRVIKPSSVYKVDDDKGWDFKETVQTRCSSLRLNTSSKVHDFSFVRTHGRKKIISCIKISFLVNSNVKGFINVYETYSGTRVITVISVTSTWKKKKSHRFSPNGNRDLGYSPIWS